MTTDLIARLEEHIAMHEEGVREQDDAKLCLCDLAEDLPAFLHALKVQQAAEAWVSAAESFEPIGRGPTNLRLAGDALVRAVKGEQP